MTPKKQTEILMNELLSFAEKMLVEHGAFHPFGGYLSSAAKVVHVGVKPGKERSTPQQKIDAMVESFKELAVKRKAIAFAIATDVRLPRDNGSKDDAVKFFLEHESGYCAEVFFCYKVIDGAVEITDTTAQQGDLLFFNTGTVH